MKKQAWKFFVLWAAAVAGSVGAAEAPRCKQQNINGSAVEMCLQPGAAFQHDMYQLKVDKVLIFSLVDDYAEHVELQHTVPDGPSIEFAFSKQGEKVVKITGGCVPESKDDVEVARVCNFYWGKVQVVKDVRFEFN